MIGNKKYFSLTVLVLMICTLLLSGCKEKDPLIATWQEKDSGITMQFTDDGKVVISNQKTSLTVTYEKQDPNILLIKGTADGNFPDQKMTYRIEEDRLILTVDEIESVFVKVK
jgi:hypothetical protein